ncbi:methyltransferase domain-containing protein [candidate division KSB1 bacterium]|nr:methyltransferase domain-containing protein [candidate division KSB1 bacterium]
MSVVLDLGPQPLCNRFKTDPNEHEFYHPLILGQCQNCGLIQLPNPVPPEEIIPRVEWLKYNEPEDHLDDLSEILCNLVGLPEKPVACGITYKDDSLLRRLEGERFDKTFRIDPKIDLGITKQGIASETIIPKLTSGTVKGLVSKYGQADLIVARHILEHAPDTQKFLGSIKQLLKPGGYIVFEVPDCSLQLRTCDYTMLWEEHMLYFVPDTLINSFNYTPFKLLQYKKYPYPVENALVTIVRWTNDDSDRIDSNISVSKQLSVGQNYANNFSKNKTIMQQYIKNYKESTGRISVFGAGHLSSMYINLMEIKDYIDFIVDDDPNKQSIYMPGSSLAVKGSDSLINEGIKLCLLSLSPESEEKVLQHNMNFVESGGVFSSIFPQRDNSINMAKA